MSEFQFGYVNDNDESLLSKGVSGVFGLNSAVNVTNIQYIDKTQKGEATSAVTIEVVIDGGTFWRTIYDATGSKLYKGNTLLNPGDEGYDVAFGEEMRQRTALVVNVVKSLNVTDEQIKAVFATPAKSFAEWATKLLSLVPANYAQIPVDVFLEYQWNIVGENTKTFLHIPINMKGGRVFAPHKAPVGKWEAVVNEKGLKYVDTAGNIHAFERNSSFMEGKKAIQQFEGDDSLDTPSNPAEASKDEW